MNRFEDTDVLKMSDKELKTQQWAYIRLTLTTINNGQEQDSSRVSTLC